jgi:hypothetical protein
MNYAKRFGLWTSALASVALMGCVGSSTHTNTPNDMGSTNAQPDTPAAYPSTSPSEPPRGTATPGTTRGPQPVNAVEPTSNGGVEYPASR